MGASRSKGILEPYTSFDAFPTEYIRRKQTQQTQLNSPPPPPPLFLPQPVPVLIRQQPVTPALPIVPVLRPRYSYHRSVNRRSPVYRSPSYPVPLPLPPTKIATVNRRV